MIFFVFVGFAVSFKQTDKNIASKEVFAGQRHGNLNERSIY